MKNKLISLLFWLIGVILLTIFVGFGNPEFILLISGVLAIALFAVYFNKK